MESILTPKTSLLLLFLGIPFIVSSWDVISASRGNPEIHLFHFLWYLSVGVILTIIGAVFLYKIKTIVKQIMFDSIKQILRLGISGFLIFLGITLLLFPVSQFLKNPDALYYNLSTFTGFLYLLLFVGIIMTIIGIDILYKSKLPQK